jgi:aryl-alcohol dehydrogenase-like predicted oxidoreductase
MAPQIPDPIPTRNLGPEGLTVSALGLGCMGMSEFYGPTDVEEAVATIRAAVEVGVTFFDTADMYGMGENEVLVGKALAPYRDKVILATKFGLVRDPANPQYRGVNGRPDYVHSACDASLQRLGTDYIDLYYQHRVDPKIPIEETVGAMSELVQAGKVRYLGLSEAAPDTISRACKIHPISALQSEWSLWSRDIEPEVVPSARENHVGIVPYSPLGRGFLTGAIKDPSTLPEGDFRSRNPRFSKEAFQANMAFVKACEQVAQQHEATPAQVALAWVLSRGEDVVPIPGTRRRKYLMENLASLGLVLSEEDLEVFDQLKPVGERYPDMSSVFGVSPPQRT